MMEVDYRMKTRRQREKKTGGKRGTISVGATHGSPLQNERNVALRLSENLLRQGYPVRPSRCREVNGACHILYVGNGQRVSTGCRGNVPAIGQSHPK